MKLLFDQNISHRIVPLIENIFPDSLHIKQLDMETASDTQIWEYAGENQFTIISKDSDSHQDSPSDLRKVAKNNIIHNCNVYSLAIMFPLTLA